MTLAPVVLFVYNRKEHTERTLSMLEKNDLAKESELYIFADGPKKPGDEKVAAVREFLGEYEKCSCFKSVRIVKAEENKGLAKSVISGVSTIIAEYRKVIVLEDDLLTSPDFLQYMNGALDFYEKEENVWSISGFNFPLRSLKRYPHDVFYTYRGCSTGWGTWEDRWNTIDWEVKTFPDFLKDEGWQKRFSRGGKDLPGMLINQMENGLDSWAVRWVYEQSNQDKYSIYPKVSRVKNIGFDGTGVHSEADHSYDTVLSESSKPVRFEVLNPEKKILRELNGKFEYTLEKKIRRRLVKLPFIGRFFRY